MPKSIKNFRYKSKLVLQLVKLKATILIAFVFISMSSSSVGDPATEAIATYIENYSELAVIEMYRSGVPASVTLAQALHESNNGLSRLAVEANNHFGIKCKSYWLGKKFQYKDDDFDSNGNLIPSCFRAYDEVVASYVDHSNFLKFGKNYESLFQYDLHDYESWAYGLKRCGYATDPNYATKLINKIELYNLSRFDHQPNPLEN